MKIVRFADCPVVPWKNGLGTTRELWREAGVSGETSLRVSIAEVRGSQPFSHFAGFDRVIMPLEGPQMSLEVDGKMRVLPPLAPFAFRGEAAVRSFTAGEGAALDLNLIAARSRYRPAMRVVQSIEDVGIDHSDPKTIRFCIALAPFTVSDIAQAQINTYDMIVLALGAQFPRPPRPALVLLEAAPV